MSISIDPARTAVLAMDFQSSILGFLEDPAPLLGRARSAVDAVRSAGGTVGFVRVGFTEQDYAAFPEHSQLGRRATGARPGMDAEAPSTAVDARLEPRESDIVVRKSRVAAFSTTDLGARLAAVGADTVVLSGVHTSGVVLSTVREAHDLDYRVIVLADACADPDPAVHEFLVDTIFPKQAQVVTTADFLAACSTRV